MCLINIANVLRLLSEHYVTSDIQTIINDKEIELTNYLKVIIDKYLDSTDFQIEEEHDLIFEDETAINFHEECHENENKENIESQSSQTSSYSGSQDKVQKNSKDFISLEYKKQAVRFWKSGKKQCRPFSSVQHSFKQLKRRSDLYIWEKQVNSGGNRLNKLKDIETGTLKKYKFAKLHKLIVHDLDLRRWALDINKTSSYKNFKASRNWTNLFKAKNRIVSRKITKFVSRNHEQSRVVIENNAKHFVEIVNPHFKTIGPASIFNSDQSGFVKELHSGRTLDDKGVKKVEAVVQSMNATTHSYTIQPTISASGKLLSPLYIVLQEPKGVFGPRVSENIFQAKNIYTECSTSGKMTKMHMKSWFENVYFPSVGEKSVLLVDSWNSFKDSETIKQATPTDKEMELLMIPEHTTSVIQPLDVYGFRFWKNFARRFTDRVMLDQIDVNLFHRNNIIKLQSLIHNQLSSPIFVELFKYGWYKSGYDVEKPAQFLTPNDVCFTLSTVKCANCDNPNFIICSWCRKPFCFDCFFEKYHFCESIVTE